MRTGRPSCLVTAIARFAPALACPASLLALSCDASITEHRNTGSSPGDGATPGDGTPLSCPAGQIPNDAGTACIPLSAWEVRRPLSALASDFTPGEASIAGSRRPQTWTIERLGTQWSSNEGLDFDAYDAVVRSPYIQDVSSDRATILWRVSAPLGIDIETVWATVLVAESGVPLDNGMTYSTPEEVQVDYVDVTYRYEDGVSFAEPTVGSGESDYWLDGLRDRPIIELRAGLVGLTPATIYHYRVESETIDPNDPDGAFARFTLAEDVHFRTAPAAGDATEVRFLAMGDLGPGDEQPSYFYDVFDLMHDATRRYGAHLWVALGDLDNDTDGHPNAMDPFFFNLYNAFHDHNFWLEPGLTSAVANHATATSVKAFGMPPYLGLLGGLPVLPTFGNHDICSNSDSSLDYWTRAYASSFVFPTSLGSGYPSAFRAAAEQLNEVGAGFFYTTRYGDIIFISLGIPWTVCDLGDGTSWWSHWGEVQLGALDDYLAAIADEIERESVWVVLFFHDHNWIDDERLKEICLARGVDLVLAGHDHTFHDRTIADTRAGDHAGSYRAMVVGTGGFGDTDTGDNCRRPGFVLVAVNGNTLEYWKLDTHPSSAAGEPDERSAFSPSVREYRKIRKEGFGRHRIFADVGLVPY